MTTRESVNTRLISAIVDVYSMTESDLTALETQIISQLTITYRQTIQKQLTLYACQKPVNDPIDSASQKWIERKARDDVKSIANTWQRELENKVSRLYASNRKGNRYFYMSNLDAWIAQRNSHKIPSISLNTFTAAREYAAQRFRDENGIEGKYLFAGPPPVCKKCMRLKAKGLVTVEMAKKYGDSQHPNCPHFWQAVTLGKLDCEESWRG